MACGKEIFEIKSKEGEAMGGLPSVLSEQNEEIAGKEGEDGDEEVCECEESIAGCKR